MFRRLADLPAADFEALAAQAHGEGYRFLDRLRDEWESGACRFEGPGEKLVGAFHSDRLVAIGGLHRDPYAGHPRVGRLRRLYISLETRRRGLGRSLVKMLLHEANAHFDRIRLRVPNAAAASFYEAIGFVPTSERDATHVRILVERE